MDRSINADGNAPASTATARRPGENGNGALQSEISNRVVQLYASYLGRGPTKARTYMMRNMIVVLLEDTLTKLERNLLAAGGEGAAVSTRRAIHAAMHSEITGTIETLTGQRVLATFSDHKPGPDLAVEVFVMAPVDGEAAVGDLHAPAHPD